MRILNICTLLPYPPVDGGRINVFYPIKHLAARGHRITLACTSEAIDGESVRKMEEFCRVEIQTWSKTPTMTGAFRSLFASESYDLKRYQSPGLLRRVRELARTEHFDVVEAGLHSAWYALELKREFGLPVVLRVHNVHWTNFERSVGHQKNPMARFFLRNETKKIRRQELAIAAAVDVNLTVSDNDADLLRGFDPRLVIRTVPAGVEMSQYSGERPPQTPRSVLWMGSLGWSPNQDSFWWFFREIVPELVRLDPSVRITVVGSNPPPDIMAVRHPNLKVLGFVEDLRGIISTSEVAVVPLRIGSGIRLKLLELFAMRSAVVSTSVGCEGLGVVDGEHILIADRPKDFAEGVARLLNDAVLRERLGNRARQHVGQHYDWSAIASEYERAYASVVHRNEPSAPEKSTSHGSAPR